jgi:copper chaperone
MEKAKIDVRGMSCDHCVKAITAAVTALPGIGSVDVNLSAGTVAVEYDSDQTSIETIKREIEDQGFDVAS